MAIEEIARTSTFELFDAIGRTIGKLTLELPPSEVVGEVNVDEPSTIVTLRNLRLSQTSAMDYDGVIQIPGKHTEISRRGYFAINHKGDNIGILLYEMMMDQGVNKAGVITFTDMGDARLCTEDVFQNGEYSHSHVNVPLSPLPVDRTTPHEQLSQSMRMLRGMDAFETLCFPDGIAPMRHVEDKYKLPDNIKQALKDVNGHNQQIQELIGPYL